MLKIISTKWTFISTVGCIILVIASNVMMGEARYLPTRGNRAGLDRLAELLKDFLEVQQEPITQIENNSATELMMANDNEIPNQFNPQSLFFNTEQQKSLNAKRLAIDKNIFNIDNLKQPRKYSHSNPNIFYKPYQL